jgi:hypothetical protein
MVHVIGHTGRAQRPQVQMGIGQLQRVVGPAHRSDAPVEAPLALLLLQRDAEAPSTVGGVDRHVVRVQYRRFVGGEAEQCAHDLATVECSERHTTLRHHGHEHVHRHQVAVGTPDAPFEGRQCRQLVGVAQFTELETAQRIGLVAHRWCTSVDSVTLSRNGRSRVTPIPAPAGTGMMPSVVSSRCSTMSRA